MSVCASMAAEVDGLRNRGTCTRQVLYGYTSGAKWPIGFGALQAALDITC